jgi:hypothetical protein
MKKTATESAERASGSRSSSSHGDAKKPKGHSFDLRLRYYNRMKLQRVYPLIVEVPYGVNTKDPTGVTVELRPVVAGAVVTPPTQRLDVTRPGAQAIFQVAPLARGRLPAARVDVVHEGRTIQELRMGMKAGTQRMTWLLLLLTLVLPPLFYHYTVFEPLKDSIPLKAIAHVQPAAQSPENAQPEGDKPAEKPQEKPQKPPVGGDKPAQKPPIGGGLPAPPPLQATTPPPKHESMIAGNPGESLAYRIKSKANVILPDVPYRDTVVDGCADGLGWVYQKACDYATILWPGLILTFLLLLATCGSWFLNLPSRRKAMAKITLPSAVAVATLRAADDGETLPLASAAKDHGETLPLSASQDDMGTVQAAED